MAVLKKLIKLLGLASLLATVASQEETTDWPLHNDGYTDLVEWCVSTVPECGCEPIGSHVCRDHYSFIVNGQRLFVFSGEFHYWRYPV
jgi:hypothetical protein